MEKKENDIPVLQKTSFQDLPAWEKDNQAEALLAFKNSCTRILKLNPQNQFGRPQVKELDFGSVKHWQKACALIPQGDVSNIEARAYFETYFDPYSVILNGNNKGLLTGYFEASLNGSLTQNAKYAVPLRARPSDLVMVNLGEFRDELRGIRIAGRVVERQLKPYETREEIETGELPKAQDRPLLFVDSAVDAFFLQIQGSGIVTLADGGVRRVGYDGQNGHVYSAVGAELIKRGHLERGNVSMQSIKAWMEQNPVEAIEVMRTNKSYVFFRFLDNNLSGPLGGEGVALTPNRSLAIDSGLYPYGMPIFIEAQHPLKNTDTINQLMIGQDTGGAIKGAIRGDYFWGHGEQAELHAGPMKSKLQFWILKPKE